MNTPTTAQPGPFRLVSDPFWISTFRDHFGRTPTRLADLQICHEELRYRRRIAELKALAPKLALQFPAASNALTQYVAAVDGVRMQFDGLLKAAIAFLHGLTSGKA